MSVSNRVIDMQPKSFDKDVIEDLTEAIVEIPVVTNNSPPISSYFSILNLLNELKLEAEISEASCWSRCCSSEKRTQILHENDKLFTAVKDKTCGLFCIQTFEVYGIEGETSIMHLRYSPVGVCYCPFETQIAVFAPPRNIIGNIIHKSGLFKDKFQILNRRGGLMCKVTHKGILNRKYEIVLTGETKPMAIATTERRTEGVKLQFLRQVPENGKIMLLAFGIYLHDLLSKRRKREESSSGYSCSGDICSCCCCC